MCMCVYVCPPGKLETFIRAQRRKSTYNKRDPVHRLCVMSGRRGRYDYVIVDSSNKTT